MLDDKLKNEEVEYVYDKKQVETYEEIEDFDDEYEDDEIELPDTDDDDESEDDVIEVDDDKEGENVVLSRHTVSEKHSLKYDVIFKGKKEDPLDENSLDGTCMYFNDTFEVDKSSNYFTESIDNENYVNNKLLKDLVYTVLKDKSKIKFQDADGKPTNRRKPSKTDFNSYYKLLRTELKDNNFTHVEVFIELALYFSDNLVNMLKLLDIDWKNKITHELYEHIGKTTPSTEIKNRNIYKDTEIEFEYINNGEIKMITGVVVECYYETSEFLVNSFEREYVISIEDITKILNNNRYRNNINKLNNIDFL